MQANLPPSRAGPIVSVVAHSVLVIPVPALEEYVRSRWEHYDPAWVARDPGFTHAHITVLAPFLDTPGVDDLARVAEIAAAVPAFDFTLAEIDVFPNGIIHLLPDPSAPFSELTASMFAAFPECPPYGGEFERVVPHLTLDSTSTGVTVDQVAGDLGSALPVVSRGELVELHRYAEADCRVLGRWSLG